MFERRADKNAEKTCLNFILWQRFSSSLATCTNLFNQVTDDCIVEILYCCPLNTLQSKCKIYVIHMCVNTWRPDGYIAKKAIEWNSQGKCKTARRKHTWRHTRMAELEEKKLTRQEAKRTAQNKVRWRALVDDLSSLRDEGD